MKKKNQLLALCALVVLVLTACENPFIPQKYKEPPPPQAPSISVEATPIGPYIKGEGVTMTAKASVSDGGELSYQWYSNTKNSSSGGTAVDGATEEIYRPSTDVSSENILEPSISYYYVQVTNTLNGKTTTATSRIIDVAVFDIPIGTNPIREVALNVTPPVKDGIPATLEGVTSTGSGYTIQSVMWNPPHNTFMSGGKYTIWVTLTANAGNTFIALRTATVNGQAAAVENNNGTTLYLTYDFPSVDLRVVTGIAVKTQPNLTYNHGDTLRLQELVVTLSYDSGEPEDVTFANFASRVITTNPAHGVTLSHTTHNNTPVVVSCNNKTADTNNLIVNKAQIAAVIVSVTAPAKDGVPNLTAATEGEAGYTVSAVSWTDVSNGNVPFTGAKFLSNTIYKATVIITARPDYEFANSMTAHINNTSAVIADNPNGTKTLSLQFDKTYEGDVVSITVTHQPTKTNYVHGETLNLAGLQVQVNFDEGTPAVIVFGDSNLLTTLPAQGEIVRRPAHNGHPIQVNYSGKQANTNILTVTQKPITLNTANASHTKVYDGNTTATNIGGVTLTLNEIVSGDSVYVTQQVNGVNGVNGVYQSADVPTNTVNITSVVLGGLNYENYTVTLKNNVPVTGGITKADPTVVTLPTTSNISSGSTLSASTLSGGVARGVLNETVSGSFAWTNPNTVPAAGLNPYQVTFTPTSTNPNYNAVRVNVSVLVISVEMVLVSGGTFQMGQGGYYLNSSDKYIAETPQTVTLSSFYIGKYEITQQQYQIFMTGNSAGIPVNPSYFDGSSGREPATGETQNRRPVEFLTWFDAVYFCNVLSTKEGRQPVYTITGITLGTTGNQTGKIISATVTADWTKNGYRLPTEYEWEFAAKGGRLMPNPPTNYAGGTIANVAWYGNNSSNKTHQVGMKQANELGLYDMTGNVSEWCWGSGWNYSYVAGTNPRSPAATVTPSTNDNASTSVRGGSYAHITSEYEMRNGGRAFYTNYNPNRMSGLRVVRNGS
jgi:formylglycine-generating enzyme required for sulfatase activity